MRLIDAPVGVFRFNNNLVLKTEYMKEIDGVWIPECYLLDSGESFWGGMQSKEDFKTKFNNLDVEVVDVEPERQWIPCSERLPDTDRNVFIARGHEGFMTACIGHYDHSNEMWYQDKNWFAELLYDAVFWCEMPTLPEPYKGEQE